jgi:predicted AAA+ superfamily ATPase
LEDSFIVFRLPALKRNLRNEVGKTRKIYFWDIGVRNMLIQNLNTLDFRNDHGALWENFCISERMKHLKKDPLNMIQPYFWRTYSQKEVDYIEDNQGKINAYEFKWSEKKKVKIPRDFTNAYKNSAFEIITPDNFYNVLYG